MKRVLIGAMVLSVGFGLGCSAEEIKSVEYYLEHTKEREAKLKKCDMKNDDLFWMCGIYFDGKEKAEKNGDVEKYKKDLVNEGMVDIKKCESKKEFIYDCLNAGKAEDTSKTRKKDTRDFKY